MEGLHCAGKTFHDNKKNLQTTWNCEWKHFRGWTQYTNLWTFVGVQPNQWLRNGKRVAQPVNTRLSSIAEWERIRRARGRSPRHQRQLWWSSELQRVRLERLCWQQQLAGCFTSRLPAGTRDSDISWKKLLKSLMRPSRSWMKAQISSLKKENPISSVKNMVVEAAASSGETLLCDGPWTACEGEEETWCRVRNTCHLKGNVFSVKVVSQLHSYNNASDLECLKATRSTICAELAAGFSAHRRTDQQRRNSKNF